MVRLLSLLRLLLLAGLLSVGWGAAPASAHGGVEHGASASHAPALAARGAPDAAVDSCAAGSCGDDCPCCPSECARHCHPQALIAAVPQGAQGLWMADDVEPSIAVTGGVALSIASGLLRPPAI